MQKLKKQKIKSLNAIMYCFILCVILYCGYISFIKILCEYKNIRFNEITMGVRSWSRNFALQKKETKWLTVQLIFVHTKIINRFVYRHKGP